MIFILVTERPAHGKELEFFVDHAQFKYEKGTALLEVYYSIPRENLMFEKVADGYQAKGKIQSYLKNESKEMLISDLLISDFADSLEEIDPSQSIFELAAAKVSEGEYTLITIFTDLIANKAYTLKDEIYIHSIPKRKLWLSDIELAKTIVFINTIETKFDKNGLRIIPYPERAYGAKQLNLFYYSEVYNLFYKGKDKDTTYQVIGYIIDQNGNVVVEKKSNPLKKPGKSAIVYGAINLQNLPPGFYQFKLKVRDDYSGKTSESMKNFYISL